MRRYLPLILAALAVGILQASFVRALPGPAAALDLPLIMIVALVTGFRFADAFIAAGAAGLAADTLSSLPFGITAAIMLLLAAVTVALFTRVFTHHSWVGAVGINLAVYALARAAFFVVRAVRGTFTGMPAFPADPAFVAHALAALGAQLAAVVAAVAVIALAKRSFSRFFFLRR